MIYLFTVPQNSPGISRKEQNHSIYSISCLSHKDLDLRNLSCSIGSLSNSVVERRTSTGSGPFALLGSGLFETLG